MPSGNICQQVQPILSVLIDELRWFLCADRLKADALVGTRLLWPTLLQAQLQRAEVLVGLAVPEPAGIQNEPWLELSVCASQLPQMLQSCWSVASMFSCLRKLNSEITGV